MSFSQGARRLREQSVPEHLARIERLPIWRGTVAPEPLAGGITNRNFLVDDGGRKVVVRLGGDIEAHGILRRNELAASRAAALAGVSPPVVHAEPGVLVIGYVEGRTLTPADVRSPANLPRIVELVARAHREMPRHLRGPGFLFWPFHVIRDYGHALAAERDGNALAVRLLAEANRLEAATGPVELVFGHNDLLAGNLLDDGGRLWLIDWDYAGFNSPLFDLGGLASNNEFSPELRRELLERYFGAAPSPELEARLAAMTAVSLLRETLWSMVSELTSDIDFDYPAYTAENLARFERALAEYEALAR